MAEINEAGRYNRDTTDKFMLNCLMKSLANDNLNDNSAADLNNSSVKTAASMR